MRIIFEEHQYKASLVQDVLKDIASLQDVEKKVSVSYVGYFYNAHIRDCVFILPKVLLTDIDNPVPNTKPKKIEVLANIETDKKDNGIKVITPEDIINPAGQEKYLTPEYKKFIFEFAVWVYRALSVYRNSNPKSKAIYYKQLPQEGRGKRHQANTYLDIILSMIRFNQENQNFFMFTIKNLHSGLNKINWTRTISKSEAIIQDGTPIYLNPINKKRKINFDEELFIIFFSCLDYLNDRYGFRAPINCQYEIIKGKRFEQYLKGYGRARLRQIKYKYFSDKALQLWDLCYAFFDASYKLSVNTDQKEYLLAKSFEHVFEAMIDELIGDSRTEIPKGLKDQADGKRVDHMYKYAGLTTDNDTDEEIYYIGDSKYYKSGNQLGRESIYKQYTYARNVIQWNIDLFLGDTSDMNDEEKEDYDFDHRNWSDIRLRNDNEDELTEGYNVIPNFFISAFVDENRKYIANENIKKHEKGGEHSTHISVQFKNRLFDRDTLILSHYDVNFLYILFLYARNKSSEKYAWKEDVRKMFRDEIRNVLEKRYDFYAMKPRNERDCPQFIKDHFKELNGKLLRPFADRDMYTLALEKVDENHGTKSSDTYILLKDFFEIEPINLGDNPSVDLSEKVKQYKIAHPDEFITEDEKDVVLLGVITKDDDKDYAFANHQGKKYCMHSIPNGNFMDVKYFCAFRNNKVEGYYEIEKFSIGTQKGKAVLNIILKDDSYISFGEEPKSLGGFQPYNQMYSLEKLREMYGGNFTI